MVLGWLGETREHHLLLSFGWDHNLLDTDCIDNHVVVLLTRWNDRGQVNQSSRPIWIISRTLTIFRSLLSQASTILGWGRSLKFLGRSMPINGPKMVTSLQRWRISNSLHLSGELLFNDWVRGGTLRNRGGLLHLERGRVLSGQVQWFLSVIRRGP